MKVVMLRLAPLIPGSAPNTPQRAGSVFFLERTLPAYSPAI